MQITKELTISVLCLAIASAVLLCSLHAKDITASMKTSDTDFVKTSDHSSTHLVKVSSDFHHHSDSTVKIQNVSNDHQVDSRSLRMLHAQKKNALRDRVASRMKHWCSAAIYRYS